MQNQFIASRFLSVEASEQFSSPEKVVEATKATAAVNASAKKMDETERKKLTKEYKKEIKDLWETYAIKNARKNCLVGVVTSTKCAKSITVTVTRQKLVPKYKKLINTRKRFMAHDEEERANLGDMVRIIPCLPKSRKKRHILLDIIKEVGQLNFGKEEAIDPASNARPYKRNPDEVTAAV